MRIRLAQQGEVGPGGGPAGDLYVEIHERPHDVFSRKGDDLHCRVTVPMTAAALGTRLTIKTLDGEETVDVKRRHPAGHRRCGIRGKGVPHLRGTGRGDLLRAPRRADPDQARRRAGAAAARLRPGPRRGGRRAVQAGRLLLPDARRLQRPRAEARAAPLFLSTALPGRRRLHAGRPGGAPRRHRAAAAGRRGAAARRRPGRRGAPRWSPPSAGARLELDHRATGGTRPPPDPRLVVVQGIAKGDRGELAVQAMTEVGVDEIVPWAAARSVAQWRGDRGDGPGRSGRRPPGRRPSRPAGRGCRWWPARRTSTAEVAAPARRCRRRVRAARGGRRPADHGRTCRDRRDRAGGRPGGRHRDRRAGRLRARPARCRCGSGDDGAAYVDRRRRRARVLAARLGRW